jgi:predicted NAD/FAD-dependent oxidoreductase
VYTNSNGSSPVPCIMTSVIETRQTKMKRSQNLPTLAEIEIRKLASKYATDLKVKMQDRVDAMEADDNSHYLIYRVLASQLTRENS